MRQMLLMHSISPAKIRAKIAGRSMEPPGGNIIRVYKHQLPQTPLY